MDERGVAGDADGAGEKLRLVREKEAAAERELEAARKKVKTSQERAAHMAEFNYGNPSGKLGVCVEELGEGPATRWLRLSETELRKAVVGRLRKAGVYGEKDGDGEENRYEDTMIAVKVVVDSKRYSACVERWKTLTDETGRSAWASTWCVFKEEDHDSGRKGGIAVLESVEAAVDKLMESYVKVNGRKEKGTK